MAKQKELTIDEQIDSALRAVRGALKALEEVKRKREAEHSRMNTDRANPADAGIARV